MTTLIYLVLSIAMRQLLLAAFVGGTLVTLPLLQRKWLTRWVRGYTTLFQGTPLLMQLFLAGCSRLTWRPGLQPRWR